MDSGATLDVAAHLGSLADELDSWGIGRWSPLGEKVLDFPINWKLAVDTFSENYHFATVHRETFAKIARSNCTVFDEYGAHHRLIFPLNSILELENIPEDQWDPFHNMVVIYALFPNIVLSVTIANGELFRIYPGDKPGRSITVHQNSTPLDLSDESVAAGARAVFDYAHATVRDEDYRLAAKLQANLESGAHDHLLFGRNEPGCSTATAAGTTPSPVSFVGRVPAPHRAPTRGTAPASVRRTRTRPPLLRAGFLDSGTDPPYIRSAANEPGRPPTAPR
ncbi:ring hydroxylating alpha subunit family protein [Mycobacterium xenopi 4042]|uniref:Ring hydroxylating alpha subunit family protein n=1 Tax=Mycobacterium xenopi 4042 TaxID=1299334 RepID=X8E5S3_MYCXE|nr:ring hydroxylating alpha subunit family protein [Mycobacterium xenopi 4042]